MATSYTGLRVQDTYNAIIKIGDNSNLTGTPKLLSDGLGNDSPLYLSGTRLGIGISPAYQFHTSGNAKIGGNLIVSGNLTVNGTLTYLNVQDLAVEDPIIKLAKDNTANTLDIGLFGKYVATGTKYKGFFNDASDDKFKLFIGTTVEPTTTVDTSATGYTVGTLVANLEGNADTSTGVLITADNTDTSRRMVFTESNNTTDTDGRLFKDSASNFYYNPSSNRLTLVNLTGTTGTFSGLLKADTLELTSGADHLTITESSGDWTINNSQQNNGIKIYDGTGGIDLIYNSNAKFTVDSAGVKVNSNYNFAVDTDTLYVDSTNEIVGINSTGNTDYKLYVNGKIATNNYVIAGLGNGGVAFTHNDGYGNANVTFNHVSGTPEQDGSSGRIVVTTDGTTAKMTFELKDDVTSGVAVDTPQIMELYSSSVVSNVQTKVRATAGGILSLQRNDTSIIDGNPLGRLVFSGDDPTDGTFNSGAEIRGEAAGTWSTNNYPSELQFYTKTTDTDELALKLDSSQNAEFRGDILISKDDPKLTFLDSTVNTDPSGQILFSELSGHRNFDINYNGTDDRLEFRGKVGETEDTDLMYINRDSTDTVEILGGLTGTTATFTGQVTIPETPTADAHAASKKYVDDNSGDPDQTLAEVLATGNTSGSNDLKMSDGHIYFYEDKQARFLSSNTVTDIGLRIQHNGSNSFIDSEIGNLYLRAEESNKSISLQADDGSGGNAEYIEINGTDERIYVNRLMRFADDVQLRLGENNDIRLYHNSTSGNNNIENHTGSLYITNYTDDEDIIFRSDDGGGDVAEYFRVDGSEQRVVYGRSAQMADNVTLFFGNDDDTFIKYDSTALKTLFVGDTDFTGLFTMKKTSTAASQTILKIHNTGDNGSQQDIILSNTFDRDVGIKFQTLGGYHHLWQDSNGDDSLIISAAGIGGADITMEFYQNHNVEIPNGKLIANSNFEANGTVDLNVMSDHESEGSIQIGRYDANTSRYHLIKNYVSSTQASNYIKFSLHNGTENSTTDVLSLFGDGDINVLGDVDAGSLISRNTLAVTGISTFTSRVDMTGTSGWSSPSYFYASYTHTTGMRMVGNESQIDIVSQDLGEHASSILLRGANQGFGLTNSNTNNRLELKYFVADDDGFTIHGSGTNVSTLTNVVFFNSNGTVDFKDDVDVDGNLTVDGSTTSGNITVSQSGTPQVILNDTGNAGGGGASGKIIFKNTAGNAIGLGYTGDNTATSNLIISTDAGSTYGGYLGLDAAAAADPSNIILDPKTNVISTKPVRSYNVFIADDIDVTNATPATDELRASGYGIIGSRGLFYITNAQSGGSVQIGNGTSHNADPTALFSGSTITHKRDTVIEGDLTLTKAQITTNIGTTSHLYISPDATTDTTGKTSIFLGTSTVDNYGISLRGARLGTDGTPTFELAVHNNSANGSVALEIDQFLGTHIKGELFIDDVDNISSTAQADKFLVMDTGDSEVRYATSSQLASAINANTGVGGAGLIPIYETSNTFTTNSNLYWDIANGRLGLGDTTPSYRLDLVTATTDTSQYSMRISHSRNNPDNNSAGLFIDANYSGTKSDATDIIQRGLHVDLDSSATGTATDEHRIYGIHSDTRNSGFADVVYGTYSLAESNYTGAKTATVGGVYGIATHDANSANGGVSYLFGVKGIAQIQDDGDVDNAYGGQFQVLIANNRDANVDVTVGVEAEIQIDEQSALTYGDMHGFRAIIDNNEAAVPTFGNQFLFKGDYQGTRGGAAYGIYSEGDRHYFEGMVSIGNNNVGTGLPLNIHHATNSQVRFSTNGSGTGTSDGFRVGYNGTVGQLFLYENADIRIATNNTPFAYFTSDQRLGIGIENATHTLHAYHATTNVIGKFQSGDNQAWISVRDDGYTTYGALFGCDHDNGHAIVLADNAVNKRLVVNNSGQVGIGFDTFTSKLSVNGNIYTSGHLLVDTNNDQYRIGEDTYTPDLTTGVMVRPSDEVNPAAGMPMFTVRSGGGSPRLFVEHDGTTGTSNNEFTIGASGTRDNGTILLRTLATSYFGNNLKVGATGDTSARLEIQKAQITTNYDTTSFLRLHPSDTTNNGGYTNMFFGSSTVDNYGISMGADRSGTSGQANFVIRNHNNSATGNMVFKVDLAGNVIVSGQTVNHIKTNTSDGSDNKGMVIDSAGGDGSSSRGAYISMYGNEHASLAGDMYITAGNTSGAELRLNAVHSGGTVTTYAGGSLRHTVSLTETSIANYLEVTNTIATENTMGTAGEWNAARIRVEATNTVDTTGFTGIRFATSTADNYGWSMGANRVGSGLGDFRIYEHRGASTGFHRVTIKNDTGYVGIKDSTPSYHIDVNGTIRATGDVIAYSDRRVKDNIETIENGLEKVTKLRGVSYTRNDIEDDSTKIGVIAQEVLEVLPEVVKQDDKGKYSVSYGNMAGLFIEAIKDLKAEINELKAEIKELKSK